MWVVIVLVLLTLVACLVELLYLFQRSEISDPLNIGKLGLCPSWEYITHNKQNDFFAYSCPEQFREGDACVASGTEIIDDLCLSKNVKNPKPNDKSYKCWRANVMELTPDQKQRSTVAVTYASNKKAALDKIVNAKMEKGIYYQDPGWCEYISKNKMVWGASSIYGS